MSVSSPFPISISMPEIMLSKVELELAFRSTLPLAEGVATELDSGSIALPIPTLSIKVTAASEYRRTLEFTGIAEELAEYKRSGVTVSS